jgi:hypothetical protein
MPSGLLQSGPWIGWSNLSLGRSPDPAMRRSAPAQIQQDPSQRDPSQRTPIQPLTARQHPFLAGGTEVAASEACLLLERRELHCSLIALTVKLALGVLVGVSLVRLAGAYQERMDRQGELAAVLDLELGKLNKARERFDHLFSTDGEQKLIREQGQWIAPNRLRVVWQQPGGVNALPSLPAAGPGL